MAQQSTDTANTGREGQASETPVISLPKGGGAIKGIGEKFGANPATGSATMNVPIATSPGRSGFGPALSLSYDSGSGNGPFGFGWSLSLPSITRKTDKGLPRYADTGDSDVFILSGAEDLVPVLVQNANGAWEPERLPLRMVNGVTYSISRYRPRIEGLYARIERWSNVADHTEVFWRSISRDNITTWYGRSPESRIYDPADHSRIFSWMISGTHDDKGNVIVYGYKQEDSGRIFEDRAGNHLHKTHEQNRTSDSRSAQRYLKRVRYGNRSPYFPELTADAPWPEPPDASAVDGSDTWLFEVVFDYGEHDVDVPMPAESGIWPPRQDPFSSFRAGFEVRTYRTCRRVLMFHHFPDERGVERNCLVRSFDFTYTDEADPADLRNPVYTFLGKVTQSGYRRIDGGYDKRSLPPLEFEYTGPAVQNKVEEVDPQSLENLPVGLDGNSFRWVDLHGEGVPGILTEQAGGWFYKRNLSPIPEKLSDGGVLLSARFAPLESVALKPGIALRGGAEFMDLAGDGQPDLVMLAGAVPGFYEHDEAEAWQLFRPFTSQLNRDLRDPNLRFVDLDGDGHADLLVTEDDAFVWHPSLAEAGFGPARRVAWALDEEQGPRIVFADNAQSIYLADLSGDGLVDIVRIRNGEVCYWPNLGYGRFGAKVTMDNAPWFDYSDTFSHQRIRLADIDGSGTTDIIYLHSDGVHLYFNQSGNSWSRPERLAVFPRVDDLSSVMALDLLGNGTACLVWSSSLPGDAHCPMRYVNLMGWQKPHLLFRTINNLGAETRVDYAPSTRFCLTDKREGKPWKTRLPFPVHVVEKVTTLDHISGNRFVTRYAYHHGYFDGQEREFRGFGMVEQWDTEEFSVLAGGQTPAENIADESHIPPVHTRTWFHTGTRDGRAHLSDQFHEPGLTDDEAGSLALTGTALPEDLTPEEEREACRALKGAMLRQEVYADDASDGASPEELLRAGTPYTVTERSFTVRTLQPRGPNRHAVFFTHAGEVINYHYERSPADPRIGHELTLEVDDFGNVLKQAAIGYGRRESIRAVDETGNVRNLPNPGLAGLDEADRKRQTTALLTYTENRVTNAIDAIDSYRNPLPCESITYELTGYAATGPSGRYQASDFVEPDPKAPGCLRHRHSGQDVAYEATATGALQRRPVECRRTLYRRDDLDGLLPSGALQSLALPGESYRLAFTPGLLAGTFRRSRAGQPDEPLLDDPQALPGGTSVSQGGYVDLDVDGCWWVPSGRSYFSADKGAAPVAELAVARMHFFTPRRYRDQFGHDAVVDFDANDLLMVETHDALGNRVRVEANDYRVLQPLLVSDPNRNRSEVAFDALGMVVGTAIMGKAAPAPAEGDTLDGFAADLTPEQIDKFMAEPRQASSDPAKSEATSTVHDLLQGATTRIVYDLHRFMLQGEAPFAATIVRETHASDLGPGESSRLQISFSYSDGFGREIQKKIQAEPGPVPQRDPQGRIVVGPDGQAVMSSDKVSPRWVGSGWTVFNNKGKAVRRFEPFFSDTHRPDFDARIGVSPVLFYDPAGRIVATLHPNNTYEKVVFDPWQERTYDVNDTCAPRNAKTGDPRTDPDIRSVVAGYFRSQPDSWQTWYRQRIGGSLGADEERAAERAATHADTPATTHFDALGRPFLTVAHNRVVCVGHELDGSEERFATRIELDIEGNQRTVRDAIRQAGDPLGRVVMRYAYDMLGNRIHQISMEAGARWVLNDVTGKPIRAWDSRGHDFTTVYDALRRPVEQYVRGTFSDPDPRKPNSDPRTLDPSNPQGLLVDRIEYGEGVDGAETLNLRTRIYRHFDAAGVAVNARLDASGNPVEAFDFKGNLLSSTRQLVSDYKAIPDWLSGPQLDDETFEGSTRYDALNRPIQSIAPHSSHTRPGHPDKFNVIQPVFNEASLLERVDVWLEQSAVPAAFLDPAADNPSAVGVDNIDYDARGQRTRIDYRNGVSTRYTYDPVTFRLSRLFTMRGAGFPQACETELDDQDRTALHCPRPLPSCRGVQDLSYTFDPAGNITHLRDDAQQTVYFRNRCVEPDSDYTYDALYRLIQATGREHLGQGGAPVPHSYDDASRSALSHPNDGNAMGTYLERYVYDAVGNILQMQHRGSDPSKPGWTRSYTYGEGSLTESGKQGNRLSSTQVGNGTSAVPETCMYDMHGNMLRMPHLGGGATGQNMFWDYKDRLRQVDKGGGGMAFYVCDASGQRVRKVWEKAPGLVEERIYLGAFEIFRKHEGPVGPDSVTLERETLQVMDDKRRIALVEMRTFDAAGNDPSPRQSIRYQFGNHLDSSSLELDEQAQIISYEEYAPYGSTTFQAVRSQTETAKWYRFTGKERDEESGFYYHGARYYAAWLGRWTACDPLGIASTLNGLAYGRGNPVRFSDPTGMADYGWPKGASFISPDNTAARGTLAHQEILPEVAQRINKSGFFTADYEVPTLPGGSKKPGSWAKGEIDLRVHGSTQGNKILDLKPLAGTEDASKQTKKYALYDDTVFSSKQNDRPITDYAENALETVEVENTNRSYLLSQESPEKLEYYRYDKVSTRPPNEVVYKGRSNPSPKPAPAVAPTPPPAAPVEPTASNLAVPAAEVAPTTAKAPVTVSAPPAGRPPVQSRFRAMAGTGGKVLGAVGVAVAVKDVYKSVKQGEYGRAAVTTGATALSFTPAAPVVMAAGVVMKYHTDPSIEQRAFAAGDIVYNATGSAVLGGVVSAGNAVGLSVYETGADMVHSVRNFFSDW